ncbi:helix-turn-helix domain-containing protein [Streptomyces sp. NPDC048331]|uniref:helix-turn-helix domain-containing protein n=1 Tax=Streptomyces sp. NPDC048331 TaxID=3365534 RepID=UPI0037120ADE
MKYRLHIANLKQAAHTRGDTTQYAIAKRTGLSEPHVSKLLNHRSKPLVETLLVFKRTYGGTVDDFIEEVAA